MLTTNPAKIIEEWISDTLPGYLSVPFTLQAGIADYYLRITKHYGVSAKDIDRVSALPDMGPLPQTLGLVVTFEQPIQAMIHDEARTLDPRLRRLIADFGVVALVNTVPGGPDAGVDQHNIFPNLQFHIDRGGDQPNQISMFVRDPADPRQIEPRDTSTLFIGNIVANLQTGREGKVPEPYRLAVYRLFENETVDNLIGDIIFEHPWQAPSGTGEIVMLDNRTTLHSSYHRQERGYPIGVRYLY